MRVLLFSSSHLRQLVIPHFFWYDSVETLLLSPGQPLPANNSGSLAHKSSGVD